MAGDSSRKRTARATSSGVEERSSGVIVCAPSAVLNELKVKAHCRERLAAYKIPKIITFVDSLPKTASGKVRRTELSKPTVSQEAP